jgi:hypothetical protein
MVEPFENQMEEAHVISRTGKAALLAAVIGGLIASSSNSSAHAMGGPCDAQFAAVESAINDATFLGKNAAGDEASLVAKVAAAEEKAAEGKALDAIAKLEDISSTADALAAAPKPKLQDASAIDAAVADAIACLNVT